MCADMLVRAEVARAAVHAAACLADAPDVVDAEAARGGARPTVCLDRSRCGGAKLLARRGRHHQRPGGDPGARRHGLHLGGAAAPAPQAVAGAVDDLRSSPAGRSPAARSEYRRRARAPAPSTVRLSDQTRDAPPPNGVPTMTDPALIPADVVRTVPEGEVVYGMQLPIQSQSTLYVADWEKEAGPVELARIARVADEAGLLLPRRVRPHGHPAPAGRRHGHHLVRHDGHARLARRGHDAHAPAVPRADPRPAPSTAGGQGALDHRRACRGAASSSAWAPATCPRSTSSSRATSTSVGATPTRPSPRWPAAFTDEFPELPGPRFPARDMGLAPRPVRQPRPPIWIGGSSPAAIRRTAAFGDGWLPQGTRRRDLPGQIARLRELRAELRDGAPIDIGTIVEPIYLTAVGLGLGPARLGPLRRRRARSRPRSASWSTWA